MSKSMYTLIVGCVGGAMTITNAVLAYLQPSNLAQMQACVDIASTAVLAICSRFVVPDILTIDGTDNDFSDVPTLEAAGEADGGKNG